MSNRVEVRPAILGNELNAKYWSGWQSTAESIQNPYRPTGKLGDALKTFVSQYLQPGWEYVTAGTQLIDDEKSPMRGVFSGVQLVYVHQDGVRTFEVGHQSLFGTRARGLDSNYRTLAFKPEVVERMTDEGPGRFFVDPDKMNGDLDGTNAYIKRINAGFNMTSSSQADMKALQDSSFKDFGFMQEGVLRVDLVIKHHGDEVYHHEGRLNEYTRQLTRMPEDSLTQIFLSGAKADVARTRAMIVANPLPLV